jgi:hypothetical protein
LGLQEENVKSPNAVEEIAEKEKKAPGYRQMTPNKEQKKIGKKMPRYLFLYQKILSNAYSKAHHLIIVSRMILLPAILLNQGDSNIQNLGLLVLIYPGETN